MSKKARMGSDPLGWIKTTATSAEAGSEAPEEEGVLGTIPKVPDAPPAEASDTAKQDLSSLGPRGNLSKQGNSKKQSKQEVKSSSQAGLPDDWTRSTVIARVDHLEKLKALAYFDRKTIKDLFDEAFSAYLKKRAADVKEAESLYKQRYGV